MTRTILRHLAVIASGMFVASPSIAQAPNGTPVQKFPLTVPSQTVYNLVVPYSEWQGVPVVAGKLNSETLQERFVLDTGLNACTVNSMIYSHLQLQALPAHVRVDVFDSSTEAQEVRIDRVQVGALRLQAVPAALVDTFKLLSFSERADAPGCWLGTPFLSAFKVTFDFLDHAIIIRSRKTVLPVEVGTVVVPVSIRGGRVFVKVTVPGGRTVSALVDTGSPGTCLPAAIAVKLKLKAIEKTTVRHHDGKEADGAFAVLPKLMVGKAEVGGLQALFYPFDPAGADTAVLGMDFLSHFKMTIDYDLKKLTLTPPPPQTPGSP